MADSYRSGEENVDRGWAWIVAFSCFITMFTVMGLFRSAGVMYVALVEALDITREMAAWPLSLCGSVMLLIVKETVTKYANALCQYEIIKKGTYFLKNCTSRFVQYNI